MNAATVTAPRRVRTRSFSMDDGLLLAGTAVSSFCLVWLVFFEILPLQGIPGFAVCWYLTFLAAHWLAVRTIRGRIIARDALMAVLISSAAAAVVAALALVISFILYKGIATLTPHFFVDSVAVCGQLAPPTCGGVGHAIVGTLEEVGIAVLIAVPLAILSAVFINEIGGPLKRPVQLFVDAMSGVPSIVAGLFIYATWVVGLHRGFSGIGASLALAILMLPTITRTSVEVLRLVPGGLREGALALGGSEWRTTLRVVLPTARSGLVTAGILGVARAVGETAPLLFTAFGNSDYNANPLSGPQEALPNFVYTYIRFNPGSGPYQRAFSAAAVLTVLVLVLFTSARLLAAAFSVERKQRRAVRRARRAAARTPLPAGGT